MENRIKKLKLAHEQQPMALGDLIHQHVRAAVEQAVHEELAMVLGVGLYERSEARAGRTLWAALPRCDGSDHRPQRLRSFGSARGRVLERARSKGKRLGRPMVPVEALERSAAQTRRASCSSARVRRSSGDSKVRRGVGTLRGRSATRRSAVRLRLAAGNLTPARSCAVTGAASYLHDDGTVEIRGVLESRTSGPTSSSSLSPRRRCVSCTAPTTRPVPRRLARQHQGERPCHLFSPCWRKRPKDRDHQPLGVVELHTRGFRRLGEVEEGGQIGAKRSAELRKRRDGRLCLTPKAAAHTLGGHARPPRQFADAQCAAQLAQAGGNLLGRGLGRHRDGHPTEVH